MATEDRELKSFLAADEDGLQNENAAECWSRKTTRARAPVPLSHQVAGHKHGIHEAGQLEPSSLSLLSSYSSKITLYCALFSRYSA